MYNRRSLTTRHQGKSKLKSSIKPDPTPYMKDADEEELSRELASVAGALSVAAELNETNLDDEFDFAVGTVGTSTTSTTTTTAVASVVASASAAAATAAHRDSESAATFVCSVSHAVDAEEAAEAAILQSMREEGKVNGWGDESFSRDGGDTASADAKLCSAPTLGAISSASLEAAAEAMKTVRSIYEDGAAGDMQVCIRV